MSEAVERQQREYKQLELRQLEHDPNRRDIRQSVVDKIKERIEESGYNPAKTMRVFERDGFYEVVDGNHRLQALHQLDMDSSFTVPCTVEPADADPVTVSIESNRDEDTFAEQDLFDYLDRIEQLRDEHTQAEIGEKLGWSRSKVKQHIAILNKVGTEILENARSHQEGRVPQDGTNVPKHDFTEGWFRNSGIYDLNDKRQKQFMEWFCDEQDCDVAKSKVESEIESLQRVQEQLEYIRENLSESVSDEDRESLIEEVEGHGYTNAQLKDAVETLNRGAKSQYHYGSDALDELEQIEDNEIDVVVTDPPWGVEFESRRETDQPDYDTTKEETLAYLERVFEELQRVCKANAHLYVFFPIAHYCEFQEVAGKFFDVNEMPLMWVKNNHTPVGDQRGYEKKYAPKYEPIYVCRMENGYERELTKDVSPNVLNYSRPTGEDRWHDSQKPVELLEDIITNVTGKHETVLDPFAGSGVTMLAAAKEDRHYIGIEQDDSYESDFKKRLREVE